MVSILIAVFLLILSLSWMVFLIVKIRQSNQEFNRLIENGRIQAKKWRVEQLEMDKGDR